MKRVFQQQDPQDPEERLLVWTAKKHPTVLGPCHSDLLAMG